MASTMTGTCSLLVSKGSRKSCTRTGGNIRGAVALVFNASIKAGIVPSLKDSLAKEGDAIFNRELEAARKIGNYGSPLFEDGDPVLTHCNAGALATIG